MAANGLVKKIGIGTIIALIPTVWLVGGSMVGWMDDRIVDICVEYDERHVESLEEEVGNMRGQLGELWMEMCDLTPEKRWYRGSCIEDIN